jgi:hypothetical protein
MSAYIEPSAGTSVVSSALGPGAVVGSTNPNLFAPDVTNASTGTTVYNNTDGSTYIYNGTSWQPLSPSIVNNPDKTVTIGGVRVAEFNEPSLGPYLTTNTLSGMQYSLQPLVARNLTYYLTPYAPVTVYPLNEIQGLGLSITQLNFSPFTLNTQFTVGLDSYVIGLSNGGLIFNPGETFIKTSVGEEVLVVANATITDASAQSVDISINFIIRQPVIPAKALAQLNNLIIKYIETPTFGNNTFLLSKNLAGNDLTAVNLMPITGGADTSGLAFDVSEGALFAMTRSGSTNRVLNMLTPSRGLLQNHSFSAIPFVDSTLLAAGIIPSATQNGLITAGAISQKDGIGFYLNQNAGAMSFAALVTMPGYVPNTIPTITQPGVVIPVRDPFPGGTMTSLINRHLGAMAWNPLNNRYYSIAMNGGTVVGGVGSAPGAPGTFVLVETGIIPSFYNPTNASPAVITTSSTYNLTFPGPPPAAFGITTGVSANSYLFSINLALLPAAPVVVINPSSPIVSRGDATTSSAALSTISTPDLTLDQAGLPVDVFTRRNSYLIFDPNTQTDIPITNGTLTQAVIKPISVNSATPIASVTFEYYNHFPYAVIIPTVISVTSIPPSLSGPSIALVGRRIRHTYRGPASVADVTTLINNTRFSGNFRHDREEQVHVWVTSINGVQSIRRTAYIHVI